jgi:hypothetical protein
MPLYKSKFTSALKTEFPFLKTSEKSEFEVFCTICSSAFSIANGGKSKVLQHLNSVRHVNGNKSSTSSKKIEGFFHNINHITTPSQYKTSAKELTFAFHTAKHRLSLRAADCTSKLISKLFDPNFSSAKTKTSCLIQNVSLFCFSTSMNYDFLIDLKGCFTMG